MSSMSRQVSRLGGRRPKRSRSGLTIPRNRLRSIISPNIHKHIRTCSTNALKYVGMDQLNGFTWNGVTTGGFNMELNFTLTGVNVYFGGALTGFLDLPNYTELK